MKTINFKFLFMFVLMLSIASVNVDAQRRRTRSRARTTNTRRAPAKNRNTESDFVNGYHLPTTERYDNALKYARANIRSDLQNSYIAKQLIAVGNHNATVIWIEKNYWGYKLRWDATDIGNNSYRCKLTNRTDWHRTHEVPIEWNVVNGFITQVWYGYGTGPYLYESRWNSPTVQGGIY